MAGERRAQYGECPLCFERWDNDGKVIRILENGVWVHSLCYEDAQLGPLARMVKQVQEKALKAALSSESKE